MFKTILLFTLCLFGFTTVSQNLHEPFSFFQCLKSELNKNDRFKVGIQTYGNFYGRKNSSYPEELKPSLLNDYQLVTRFYLRKKDSITGINKTEFGLILRGFVSPGHNKTYMILQNAPVTLNITQNEGFNTYILAPGIQIIHRFIFSDNFSFHIGAALRYHHFGNHFNLEKKYKFGLDAAFKISYKRFDIEFLARNKNLRNCYARIETNNPKICYPGPFSNETISLASFQDHFSKNRYLWKVYVGTYYYDDDVSNQYTNNTKPDYTPKGVTVGQTFDFHAFWVNLEYHQSISYDSNINYPVKGKSLSISGCYHVYGFHPIISISIINRYLPSFDYYSLRDNTDNYGYFLSFSVIYDIKTNR
jgi:hypothetical protein